MDYDNRIYNYSDKLNIKDRNYSYYLINNNNKKDKCITDNRPPIQYSNDNNNLISSNMRMSNIESRLNTMEKMMKYFDEFIHLKEEEKINNLNSLEISTNIPTYLNDLLNKVDKLEKELNNIKKQKHIADKTIENLTNKIQILENIINNNNLNKEININEDEIDNNINTDINKIQKLNNYLSPEKNGKEKNNKNLIEFEEIVQNKLNEIYNNNKISEMLSLIEDINKIAEDNEFNINEQNENIRKIQNDNLTLIKIVAVHSEKINNIDYILNELTNLKNKYYKILSIVNNVNNANNEKEEEIFTNEFIAKYKVDNNQNDENNVENNNTQ